MRPLLLAMLLALLAACSDEQPHHGLSAGPDDPAAPSAARPYAPVMAGTVYHGIGDQP